MASGSTISEAITQLQPLFDKVAAKIGEGTQFGWELAVRQAYIVGVFGIITAIVSLAVLIFTVPYCIKEFKASKDYDFPTWAILGITISITFGITFFGGLMDAVYYLLNPEFQALEYFIRLVK